jgi:DNA transformation protein and related proteins
MAACLASSSDRQSFGSDWQDGRAGRKAGLAGEELDNDAIQDVFSGLGPVSIRRMFGGKGIYFDGLIVAIELRGELMLKADETSAPDFLAAGAKQWTYVGSRHGKTVAMPYWSVPENAFDDPEEMTKWTRLAFEAARRIGK